MRILGLTCLLAFLFASVTAAGEAAPRFDGKVVTVSVFKNGYGFFRVEGTATVKDGKVEVSPVPAAALGTWWFYTRKSGATIEEALAAQREVTANRTPLSVDELISANIGRDAIIETEKAKYMGAILPNWAVTANPPFSDQRFGQDGSPAPSVPRPVLSRDVELKAKDGSLISIRSADIHSVSIVKGANEFGEKKKEGYVTLFTKGAADGQLELGYQFLQKGIRWIPSYRIELVDEKTAQLVLQGEVVNDIQDLDGATLQLVVGVPNFVSGDLLSPLAYVSEMPRLSVFFQPPSADGRRSGYYSNYMASQRVDNLSNVGTWNAGAAGGSAPEAPDAAAFAIAPEITGKGVSDLFYYTKDDVTLSSGERASLNVLSAQLAYTDVYKWRAVDKMLKNSNAYRNVYDRLTNGEFNYPGNITPDVAAKLAELSRQDAAEHFVRLTNSSGKPFTSGPALLFTKGDVLAQDVLNYTPAGSTADVKITAAPDVKVNQKEEETSRERGVRVYSSRNYDFVKGKVTLTVANSKKESIHMIVTKTFNGTVMEAPAGGTATQDTSELAGVNPHTSVEWEFDLEPGASKELVVTYSTYILAD
jgi:hypothetical protein